MKPMKKGTLSTAAALAVLYAQPGVAQNQFDANAIYFGGGLSANSWGSQDELGWQVFGGYDTGVRLGQADLAVEAGYMRAGEVGRLDRKVDGIWATGVASLDIGPQWTAVGRLGLDFGDDDGPMLGAGIGYAVAPNAELRAEFVIRDNIDSLQLNYVYRP